MYNRGKTVSSSLTQQSELYYNATCSVPTHHDMQALLTTLMKRHMPFVPALRLVHHQRSYHEGCSRPFHPNASHIQSRHRTTTNCYDTSTRLPKYTRKNFCFHYSMVIAQKFLYRKAKKTKLESDHIFLDASNADQLIYYTILDFHAIHMG